MNVNSPIVPGFVGHFAYSDKTQEFFAHVRRMLTKTPYRLCLRGRNTNRKQFAKESRRHRRGGYSHDDLRRSIPLKFSTYVSAYLLPRFGGGLPGQITAAKERIAYLVELSEINGTDLRKGVPTKPLAVSPLTVSLGR